MKEILHLTQSLSGGGAARELVYLAAYSSQSMAYQHRIVTLHPSTRRGLQLADAYQVQVIETPTTTRLHEEIHSADILQVHWWNNPEISHFLHTQFPKTRLIIRYHVAGEIPPHKILPQHFQIADANIISFDKLSLLAEFSGEWKKDRTYRILHGTDFNRINKVHLKPHKGFNVGYIGTVSYLKMHPDYLKMSAAIDIRDVKFIICGQVEEPELLRFAQGQNQDGKFDFRGYVEDIAAVISEMDVFGYPLCPQTYASTDLVLQEVMHAGIPAVVFPYGGLTQTVKDGFNGIIVQNADEYKKAIEYLYRKPEERARMGANAKKHIRRHFGIQNTVKQYHEIYQKLLQQPKIGHEWGKDAGKSLLEQPLTLSDITGITHRLSAAELFSESLGEQCGLFKSSMSCELSVEELLKVDIRIAELPHLVYQGGIIWYLNYDPGDAYLNFWAGLNALNRGENEKAANFFTTALNSRFAHWRLYYYLATALKTTGKTKETQAVLHSLSKIRPGYEKEIAALGKESLLLLGKQNPAEKQSSETAAETMQRKAEALACAGKAADAIQILLQLLSDQPANATAYNDLGVLYYNSGEKNKALQCYQKAAELESENAVFQKNLADFYYVELNRVQEAMQIYVKVLNANPDDIEALLNMAHICVALEKFDDAKDFFNRTLAIEPGNKEAGELLEKSDKWSLSEANGQTDRTNNEADSNRYLVSAIVSTYNSERFIRGCLEALEAQTIADRIEIIVVDSGSEQNDRAIVKEFQLQYNNIFYIRTEKRETVYTAWNRAIKAASGKYITNANTDDRLRVDGIEKLVKLLEENPGKVLAYGNSLVTCKVNETFSDNSAHEVLDWPDFSRETMLGYCYIGPHPLWRKDLHEKIGYFDTTYRCAADWDFWIRAALGHDFIHLDEYVGLYYLSDDTVSRKGQQPLIEAHSIRKKYRQTFQRLCGGYIAPPRLALTDDTKKNILFVVHNFPPFWYAGTENYVYNSSKELEKNGWNVHVIFPHIDRLQAAVELRTVKFEGLQTWQIWHDGNDYSSHVDHGGNNILKLFDSVLQHNHYDLIHFHHFHGWPLCIFEMVQNKQIPSVVTLHDFTPFCYRSHLFVSENDAICSGPGAVKCSKCLQQEIGCHFPANKEMAIVKAFESRLTRAEKIILGADMVTAPSRYVADTARRFANATKDRIQVKALGLSQYAGFESRRIRTTDDVVFGFMGNLTHLKNVSLLIRAFLQLKGQTRLKIWGTGEKSILEYVAKTAAQDERITYQGKFRFEDITRIVAEFDVAVIPSFTESYSLTTREAFLGGRPVIAASAGALPEIVRDGHNGYLFASNDQDDLRSKMQRIVDNPKIIDELAKNIPEIIDIAADVQSWRKIYDVLSEDQAQQPIDKTCLAGNKTQRPCLSNKKISSFKNLSEPLPGQRSNGRPGKASPGVNLQLKPTVSIIIPVFNQLDLTKGCLKSVIENTGGFPYEIILVDNASTDGSKSFLQQFQNLHSNVRVIFNKENKGFAAANNQAVSHASGKYVLFLNNDTQVRPDWLGPLVSVSEYDPEVGAVGSKLLFPDGNIQHAGVIIIDDRLRGDPLLAIHNLYRKPGNEVAANRMRSYQALTAACLMVNRSLFDDLGGFDEKFWNGYEDVDLCFRIGEAGYKLIYQPKSVVTHFESQSGSERFSQTTRNIDWLHRKWIGKISPDFIVTKDDVVKETSAGKIRPYKTTTIPSQSDIISNFNQLTSIVILTKNQLQYTRRCLESIHKNTRCPYEVIVVDNASNDGTVSYIEKDVSRAFPEMQLHLIKNDINQGFAGGNNQGIAAARGDLILLMNNDIVVTPGWLETMLGCMQRHPLAGIVGPKSNFVSGPQRVETVTYNLQSLSGLNEYAKQHCAQASGKSQRLIRVVGFCMLVKREVIEKIGGLDDRYGLGNFEDDDFSLRAALAGFESWMAEDCFIHHFGNRTFMGENIDYRQSLEQNWEIFKQKWGLPQELAYGSNFHLSNTRFIPSLHYVPLEPDQTPKPDTQASHTAADSAMEAVYAKVQSLLQLNQVQKAALKLEAFLRLDPACALAHNDLGTLYFNIGEKGKAVEHYRTAIQLQPSNITFKKNLADFYCVELGKIEKAMQIYVEILNWAPTDIESLLAMGHICRSLSRHEEADSFYSRVLEFDAENEIACKFLGRRKQSKSTSADDSEPFAGDSKHTAGLAAESRPEPTPNPIAVAMTGFELLSILVPAAGSVKQLRRCVQAIERQTPEPHELLFLDRGLAKATGKWLQRFLDRNDHCRRIRCKRGDSTAAAFNTGIEASRGDLTVWLSNDVEVTPGWLPGMLAHLKNTTNSGIVGAMSNIAVERQKVPSPWGGGKPTLGTFASAYQRQHRHRRIPVDTVDGFCVLLHRHLIERVGPLDVKMGQGGYEIEDLCLRAALADYQNLVAGDVYLHRRVAKAPYRSKKAFDLKWSGADSKSAEGKGYLALLAARKAHRAWQAERVDLAGEFFMQAIALAPQCRSSYCGLAKMLIQTRQFKEALEVLDQLPGGSSDAETLVLTAICEEGLKHYEKAQQLADCSLDMEPNNASVLNIQGILAYRKKELQAAGEWFQRAVKADPGFAEAYTNRGALKWEAGEKKAAFSLYERGFICAPDDHDIASTYHSIVSELVAYNRAEPIIRDAAAAYPHCKKIRYMQIDSFLQRQEYRQAMAEIEAAMAAFGIDDGILASALKIREMIGPLAPEKPENAGFAVSLCMIVKDEEEHLAKCLFSVKPVVDEIIVVDTGSADRSPDIARALGARVSSFTWTGDFAVARNHALSRATGKVIFVMDADEVLSPLEHTLFRRLCRKSARRKQAFIVNTRNYTFDNNQVNWVTNEGHYGQDEAGTGWIPSAKIRIFPNDSTVRYDFPVHEMVELSLEKAGIAMKPCNLQIHHYGKLNRQKSDQKGELYYEIGRKKLAQTGDAPIALKELAIQAEGLKKHDEAVKLWERYITKLPDDPQAYINLGISYCRLGRFDKVLETAKKTLRLRPNSKEGLYNYALAKLHLGRPRQALETLQELCHRLPEYLPARFLLAATHCAMEKKDSGMAMLDELSRTAIGPGLATRCYELALELLSSKKSEYASAILGAAIDGRHSSKAVLDLYADCTKQSALHQKTGTYN